VALSAFCGFLIHILPINAWYMEGINTYTLFMPVLVAVRSEDDLRRLVAEIAGANPASGIDVDLFVLYVVIS